MLNNVELKFNYSILEIVQELRKHKNMLFELYNRCNCDRRLLEGRDGSGLNGGTRADEHFEELTKGREGFEKCHQGQSDFKILGTQLSFKKVTRGEGSPQIAVFWSINGNDEPPRKFDRHIMILVLEGQRWYKKDPKGLFIPSGLYVCDKDHANEHVKFGKNNKSNSIVVKEGLHKMLAQALYNGWFIPLWQTVEYIGKKTIYLTGKETLLVLPNSVLY
jgi:hypothetical protein